jgi:hypothetical protein
MPTNKKPVAIFCGDSSSRIFAAPHWRIMRRVGAHGGIVKVTGRKDDVTRVVFVAVAKHLQRCEGCPDCAILTKGNDPLL